MAFSKIIEWYLEFELDGDTHVAKATGLADESTTRPLIQQSHPKMNITVMRPLKNIEEIYKRAAELANDPNHVPLDNQHLKEDAARAILQP